MTEQIFNNFEVNVDVKLSKEECRNLHERGYYKDKRGTKHALVKNGKTGFSVYEVGDVSHSKHETYCQGQSAYVNGELVNGIVRTVYYNVELYDATIRFGENEVEALESGDKLSCIKEDEGCFSDGKTYSWKNPAPSCRLVQINQVEGHFEKDLFVSHQAGLVVTLGEKKVYPNCHFQVTKIGIEGYSILSSNLAETYGYEILPYKPADYNIVSWTEAKDKYSDYVHTESRGLQSRAHAKEVCENIQGIQAKTFSLTENSRTMPGRKLGKFTMRQGEVLAEFSCPIVEVSPRQSETCTDEFPVWFEGKPMYMQPVTRILGVTYTIVPCSEYGSSKFRAKSGRYMHAYPHIAYVQTPTILKNLHWTKEEFDYDIHPGLYNEIEQKQFRHSIEFSSKKHEITAKITGHWCEKNSPEGCGIDSSSVFDPRETEKEKPWGSFFLDGFFHYGFGGTVASLLNWFYEAAMKIAFGCWACYCLIKWILHKISERDNRNARNALSVVVGNDLKTPAVDHYPPAYNHDLYTPNNKTQAEPLGSLHSQETWQGHQAQEPPCRPSFDALQQV